MYAKRYEVTIQLLLWKPFRAFVMAISDVAMIVVSMVDRKRLRHNLSEFQRILAF